LNTTASGAPQPTDGTIDWETTMTDRVDFDIDCPNNHNQTVTFSQKEFEEVLKAGALVFHCNTCDTDWSASGEEIAKFRREFAKLAS
jgi:hypothetical protein